MSLASKLNNLISEIDNVTGESSNDLTEAIQTLIDGYIGGERYSITWNLTNVDSSTKKTHTASEKPFSATISAKTGYTIDDTSIVVTMGGLDITSTAYNNGAVSIGAVTGNITITALATINPIDLLNVSWANYAITCGEQTNAYNGWCPHNIQYDDINDCFVFLQCHCDKHLNKTCTSWTLCIIDPYDPANYTDIPIPTFNGLGNLVVEKGVWTIIPRNQLYVYRSSDMGETWDTLTARIPNNLFGVYKCGDTYYGGNDTNTETTYFKSNDLLTWETVSFSSDLGYSVLCETTFCDFNGYIWAFNRTNDSELGHPVVLRSDDDGETWELFSDSDLHGYRSTVSCQAFASYIMVADIDRDNGILYYNKFDGETFETLNSWNVPNSGDDFHNVNIATNYKDAVMLVFMHSVSSADPSYTYFANAFYAGCDNVMLLGSVNDLPHIEYTYYDTAAAFVEFANSNLTEGVNGGTYTWDTTGGARCVFPAEETSFVDEIELPLGLIQCHSQYSLDIQIKDGENITAPYNNTLTRPTVDMNQNRLAAGTSHKAYFVIGDDLYSYGSGSKANELPVLTKVNAFYDVAVRGWAETQNDITGQEWQENLGFRKVFSINRNTSGSSSVIANNNFFNVESAHKIAVLTFVESNEV